MLAILAHQLMAGTAIPEGWVQIAKNNVASSDNDDAIYQTDFVLKCDGSVIGYLDTEEKQGWSEAEWPYKAVNVAKHPMSHWQRGRFGSRPTNKLLSFQEMPDQSWWIGMRKDWHHAVLVNAADLFEHGQSINITTAYSKVPLPVLRFPNSRATLARSADEFTTIILNRVRRDHAVR